MLPTNIPPTFVRRADEATTQWFTLAQPGTTLEQVLDPDYFAHVAARLLRTPNRGMADTIRVFAEDGTLDVEVTVVAVDPRGMWAQVRPLRVYQSDKAAMPRSAADKDGYLIEFAGPHRWRIVSTQGEIVARDLPDEAAAHAELTKIKAAKNRKAA